MKIFCAICDANYNTTRAAENLNMTQPAVSLAIKELEKYYGIVLFDRIGRRLQITPGREKIFSNMHFVSPLSLTIWREKCGIGIPSVFCE